MPRILVYNGLMRRMVLMFVLLPTLAVVAGSASVLVAETSQVEICSFGQNLYAGAKSPEVRCLQRFLNASGFSVALEGPGSSGNETDYYGARTERAVAQWQNAMGVSPVRGFFGPRSRFAYQILTGRSASASGISPVATVPPKISAVIPDHITDGDTVAISGSGFTADGNFIRYSIDPPGFAGRSASADGAGLAMQVRVDTAIRAKIRGQIAGLPAAAQGDLKIHFAKSINAQYGIAAAAGAAYIPIDLTVRNKNGASAPFKIHVNVIP